MSEPELSGLAASTSRPGVVWAISDSGEGRRNAIYGYRVELDDRPTVVLVETHEVAGQRNGDWEDLAVDGTTLWIADVGNNTCTRQGLRLLAVPEPPAGAGPVAAAVHPLRWEDAPRGCTGHDTEAVFVVDGMPYLLTKATSAAIYRPAALTAGREQPLVKVLDLPPAAAFLTPPTGAAVGPDAGRVLVTTEALQWHVFTTSEGRERGDDRVRALFAGAPAVTRRYLRGLGIAQVESATFLAGGRQALLAAESGELYLVSADPPGRGRGTP